MDRQSVFFIALGLLSGFILKIIVKVIDLEVVYFYYDLTMLIIFPILALILWIIIKLSEDKKERS